MSFVFKYRGRFRGALPGLSTFFEPLKVVGSLLGLIMPVADAAVLLLQGFKFAIELILMPILFFLGLVSGALNFLTTLLSSLGTAMASLGEYLEFTLATTTYKGAMNQFQVATASYFVTGNAQLLQSPLIFNNAATEATVVVIAFVANGVGTSLRSILSGIFPPMVGPKVELGPLSPVPLPLVTGSEPQTFYIRYSHMNDVTETFASPATAITVPDNLHGIHVTIESGPPGVVAHVYIGTDEYDLQRSATLNLNTLPAGLTITELPPFSAAQVILNPIEDAFRPSPDNVPYELKFTTTGSVLGVTWRSPKRKPDLYGVRLFIYDSLISDYIELNEYPINASGTMHTKVFDDLILESGKYKVTVETTTGSAEVVDFEYAAPDYFTLDSQVLEPSTQANKWNIGFSTQRTSEHKVRVTLYDATDFGPPVAVGVYEDLVSGENDYAFLDVPFLDFQPLPADYVPVPGRLYYATITDMGGGPVYAPGEMLQTAQFSYVVPTPLSPDYANTVATMTDLEEKPVVGIFRFLSTIVQLITGLFGALTRLVESLQSSVGQAAERKLGLELMIKYFEDQIAKIKKIVEDLKKFFALILKMKLTLDAGFDFGDVYIYKYSGPLSDFGDAATATFTAGLPGVSPASAPMEAELYVGTSTGSRAFLDLLFGA